MTVTRTIYADVPLGLAAICKAAGFPLADTSWRYGALGTVGGVGSVGKASSAGRTSDERERKRRGTRLERDAWLSDAYLHRMMRKHCCHGKSDMANQFIVRSDKDSTEVIDGNLTITTSGNNVDLTGCHLRVLVKDGCTEIH